MGRTDRLADMLKGRPEEIGKKMRRIGLERSHEIRHTGKFREKYLPEWYGLMKEAYGILVEDEPLPTGVKREHLYYLTNAAREVMEDNLTPIKAVKLGANYEDYPIVGGPLERVLQFNKRTVLSPGGKIEGTPLSRYKTPLEDKRFQKTVDFDTNVNLDGAWTPQIQWRMDYRIMGEAFDGKDYYGASIKPDRTLWFRVKFRRKDPFEIAYHGGPENMA